MIVLSIGSDAKLFDPESEVRKRILLQASLFAELHVVVISRHIDPSVGNTIVLNNLFLYPVRSRFKPILFLKSFLVSFSCARKLKKKQCDVYVTSQDPFEIGLIALITAKMFKFKLQFQLHTDCFNPLYIKHSLANYFRAMIARFIIIKADTIRTVSEKIKASILNIKSNTKIRISVLPVWLDIKGIKEKKINSNLDLKQRFPEAEKIILVVARLESEKNITLTIHAFQKMLKVRPNLLLVIAGSGSKRDWLIKYSRYLGVESRVKFLGWQSDTISLYRSADLLIVSSFYEGYGLNIVEALVCGLPVVSTDVGIAQEAGTLVVPYDPGRIAKESLCVLDGKLQIRPKRLEEITEDEYWKRFKETFN